MRTYRVEPTHDTEYLCNHCTDRQATFLVGLDMTTWDICSPCLSEFIESIEALYIEV